MQKLTIGVDIGGTNTSFGIVNRQGTILYTHTIRTQTHDKVEDFISELCREIKSGLNTIAEKFELIGIGIGAPNANYLNGTIEDAANLRWKGKIELSKLVNQHLNAPVFVTNDANAAAIGEKIYGGAKNMNDFIVITLGTGLGSGIVSHGKLLYGHDGFAGELGHTIVEPNGRACGCGRSGCLETYVSATGLVRSVAEQLSQSFTYSVLRDIPFNKITSKDVATAAENGDLVAIHALKKTGRILGEAIANIIAITSPEAIFLFGGLTKAGKILLDEVKYHMDKNILFVYKNKVTLLISQLPDDAAILGASALVWTEFE